ncbi:MAG: helix-turn-helix domain-containing protein [Bacteroidaceae bacterium]|nr:helix-turn-helix domain-containing protein [Bacteroidaceae bacterium]
MARKRRMESNLQNRPTQQRENRHRPVTPEQVAEYTNILLATIYQKLANREIPGSKPGKRLVIYLDEIDKWLEANRKNPIPLTDEEQNAAILASHKCKPNKSSWNDEGSARRSQPHSRTVFAKFHYDFDIFLRVTEQRVVKLVEFITEFAIFCKNKFLCLCL